MKGRALFRRAGWNLTDQVISSATNAALSFLVARAVSVSDFGGFALAFTVFAVVTGLSRAVSTMPLSVRFTASEAREFDDATGAAVGTAVTLGVLAGLGCLVPGLILDGAAGTALLVLGLLLPGLLMQDAWRLVFFAEGRPAAAAANDAFWAVTQLLAVGGFLLAGMNTIGPMLLAWGGAAAAAAALGKRQSGVWPRPRRAWGWVRRHHDLTRYLLAEYVTVQGAQQGALLVIAGISSLAVIGALRGAQVILGPTTILAAGMNAFALPEMSRRRAMLSERDWNRGAVLLSAFVSLAGTAWGVIFLLLPDSLGVELLGDTWAGTRQVLLATVVGQAGAALGVGPATALYAMDRASSTFRIHVSFAPLMFVLSITGVSVAGAQGAAWGIAAAFWLVLPLWWVTLRRQARDVVAEVSQAADEVGGGPASKP